MNTKLISGPAFPVIQTDLGSLPAPGYYQVGTTSSGSAILHATATADLPDGFDLLKGDEPWEWGDLISDLPEVAERVLRATVYRQGEGSLRAAIMSDLGVTIGSKVPQTGHSSASPDDADEAGSVLMRARALVASGQAVRRRVAMHEILDSDVVESDLEAPHYWL